MTETKEEELSRCREELEYWSKTENHTERTNELEGEDEKRTN